MKLNELFLYAAFLFALMCFVAGCSKSQPSQSDGDGREPVPGTMELVSQVETGAIVGLAEISGDILITTTQPGSYGGTYSIRLYSISDPENPSLLATYPSGSFPSFIMGMDVLGDVLYVTAFNKLYVIDISNPSSPLQLGEMSFSSQPYCVSVGDGVAFVGFVSANGVAVDVSNPSDMNTISDLPVQFTCCDYRGGVLYCAPSTSQIYALDVSTPDNPTITQNGSTGGQNLDIEAADNGLIYVAGGTAEGTNNAVFAVLMADDIDSVVYLDVQENLAAARVARQDHFAYVLMRPQGGYDYSLRTYFVYDADSISLAFDPHSVLSANDVAAGNGYVYVTSRGESDEGLIYIFKHSY